MKTLEERMFRRVEGWTRQFAQERTLSPTPEMHLAAVTRYWAGLSSVPEDERSVEICIAAVKAYPTAINWVPDEHKKTVEAALKLVGKA